MGNRHQSDHRNEAAAGAARHIPVLLAEVLDALQPADGETILDGTFGAGGYTTAILEAARCNVIALDRDPSAVSAGAQLVERFSDRLHIAEARFSRMDEVFEELAGRIGRTGRFARPAGIVLDISVSSMQIDEAVRGFSFQDDGPLDMRMGHAEGALSEGAGPSAAEFINTASEALLADVLYELGEERRSRAVAAAIVRRRSDTPFARTKELADLVASVPGTRRPDGKHPATRTFQALRIWVNDELGELARGLAAAERLLAPGGRLAVVTFHSLEDRIAKRFLADRAGKSSGNSRHLPSSGPTWAPSFRLVNSKSVSPGEAELERNPRSRSARLRWALRTEAPAWPDGLAELQLPAVLRDR